MSVPVKGSQQPSKTPAALSSAGAAEGARLFGPRGRHRRPRPRKVLLAAGGLALAAGALSLVRLTPDSTVDGLGTTEAEPHPTPDTDMNGSTETTTTVPAAALPTPKVSPSATTVMGGVGTTPTADSLHVPTKDEVHTPPLFPAPTAPPAARNTPDTGNAELPAPPPTTTAPQPAPKPTPSAPHPDQPGQPGQPDDGSVCVPVVGLCVDPLSADN